MQAELNPFRHVGPEKEHQSLEKYVILRKNRSHWMEMFSSSIYEIHKLCCGSASPLSASYN